MMKKIFSVIVTAALMFTTTACSNSSGTVSEETSETSEMTETTAATEIETEPAMRDITTAELVSEMGYGINMGNTLEACGDWINGNTQNDYERAWGSPTITQEFIQGYADAGFGVLRIPVAWSNMMEQDGTYTINPEVMARVTEVVDWALETDMYVIINIHWDNGWVNTFPENKEECMKRFTHMWEQIAENFENYGDKLMFESQNEELGWDSIWNPWGSSQEKKRNPIRLPMK